MPPKKAKKNELEGKIIVFTGTLEMKRADAKAAAEAAGATVTSAVSGKTDILIAGPDAGQKMAAAEAKGVEVWTEAQFFAAVGGGAAASSTAKDSTKKTTKKRAAKDEEDDEEPEKEVKPSKPAAKKAKVNALEGKIIVFTGTLEMKRADAKAAAEAAGATVTSAVSGKTDILIAGPDAGQKMAAAEAKGVEVWTEAQFFAAVGGGAVPAPAAAPAPAPAPAKSAQKAAKVAPPSTPIVSSSTPSATPSATPGATPGARQPDRLVPDGAMMSVHGDYDARLMFTDIGGGTTSGNNKFYRIQVLQGKGSFWAWNRWGRLGENGQNSLEECSTADEAIQKFRKKFKDKTRNDWSQRGSFVKHSDKYQFVEVDEDSAGGGGGEGDSALGKLSIPQIEKGQRVLSNIRALLEGGGGSPSAFLTFSSEFYSLIPTTSGRKKPDPINNMAILQAKESLLDFWLRMGFEDMKEDVGVTPISGVMELPLPASLDAAASNISDMGSIRSSQTRADQLVATNAGKPIKPMDRELYASILLYTGNSIYAELNRVLRSEDRKAAKKFFNYLRLFMEAMGCMPQQRRTLWRGISADLFEQYAPGKVITWWSVSSCTADQSVARNFMQGCGGQCTLITLDCETAVEVSALSFYSNEKESLLAPGTQLEVISRTKKGNIAEINVREVGRAMT